MSSVHEFRDNPYNPVIIVYFISNEMMLRRILNSLCVYWTKTNEYD